MDALIYFKNGLPDPDFFKRAWEGEPLLKVLKGVDLSFALPASDPSISLLALEGNKTIGQCSANPAPTYWSYFERIRVEGHNDSTRVFIAIQKKAVYEEMQYLNKIGRSQEAVIHNSGIAVLPEYRGRKLGTKMLLRQIELCKKLNQTGMFCETTHRHSASIVEGLGFTQITKYPYQELAKELDCIDLGMIDDAFTIWCLLF